MQPDTDNWDDTHANAASIGHYRAALDALPYGLVTFDANLHLLVSNTLACDLLGFSAQQRRRMKTINALIRQSRNLSSGSRRTLQALCGSTAGGPLPKMMALPLASTSGRGLSWRICPAGDGTFIVTVTEIGEAQADGAARDTLTGLPNRAAFGEHLGADADSPTGLLPCRAAILVIDLDRFKTINDTFGYATGDELLRIVASRLGEMLLPDAVAARLGGNEFAVLLPQVSDPVAAIRLAKRIVGRLGQPCQVNGQVLTVSASVGIAIAPNHGGSTNALMRNADLALIEAKSRGGGISVEFQTDMDTRASARRRDETDLRKALILGEFFLHYQPLVDLQRQTIISFEALLRWQHPERGLVSPANFIPLAEEIGMIVPLGEWVLAQACQEATRWPDAIAIAVNVSPRQFEDADRLVNAVAAALAQAGLPGDRLELEVTESVLLRDAAGAFAALHRLRLMGIRITMDDFGTGYSSLSQLHSFPFDKIKIDRSFVWERADSRGQDAIIRAIAALGAGLGMAITAEGVETVEQLARVRNNGCTSGQGFLFSRPITADEVRPLIAHFNWPDSQVLSP